MSQARQLGFGPGTPLYYDMEAYSGTLNGRVLRFLTSWTRELHTLGYSSGVYSNSLSGIQALASNYTNTADTMPDVIYDALWNGAANTLDPILSSTQWAGHHRVHQYQGGQNVTYGGATVNIDQDYLDVQQEVTGGSPQASQAAAQSAEDVDAFFKGTNGKLWHDWYAPGSGWHGPVSMGGSLATQRPRSPRCRATWRCSPRAGTAGCWRPPTPPGRTGPGSGSSTWALSAASRLR